jgi:NTE family protein
VQYVMIIFKIFITPMSREYPHDQYWKNTIIVNTGKPSPVDFNMSIHDKETLYAIDYKTALEFIPKRLNGVETAITENELKFTDPKV